MHPDVKTCQDKLLDCFQQVPELPKPPSFVSNAKTKGLGPPHQFARQSQQKPPEAAKKTNEQH